MSLHASQLMSPSSKVLLAGCEGVTRAPILRTPTWPHPLVTQEGGTEKDEVRSVVV